MKKSTWLVGQKFGLLTVIGQYPDSYWECRCECGAVTAVLAGNLKSGNTKSCGRHYPDGSLVPDNVRRKGGHRVAKTKPVRAKKWSPEHRAKLREALSKRGDTWRANLRKSNQIKSPEHREKLRQAALNRSPETRERMRLAQQRRQDENRRNRILADAAGIERSAGRNTSATHKSKQRQIRGSDQHSE